MSRLVYRLAYLLLLGLWVLLSAELIGTAQQLNIPLISVRVTSSLVTIWLLIALALILFSILGVVRGRAAFKRQVQQLQTAAQSLNEGMILVNRRGKIQWSNAAAEQLLSNGHLDEVMTALVKRAHTTQRAVLQTIPISEAGMYAIQIMPLPQRMIAILCRPVQAAGAQNTFYENFIRRIVHDMRNPLAAIIGHASNLSQSASVEPEAWRRSVHTIEDEAQRLTRLVDSMLFDARLAYVPLQLEPVDLGDLLEEAVYAQDERALREGKTLQMDTPVTTMKIEADCDLLVRAFENLIDNSLKYSGANGRLTILLDALPGLYRIRFEDNGEGIPPEFLPDRIFQPLVRARPQGSGSGLGLSIVRKIIEMHGGTITAQSRVGVGTTMTVELPKPNR